MKAKCFCLFTPPAPPPGERGEQEYKLHFFLARNAPQDIDCDTKFNSGLLYKAETLTAISEKLCIS